MSGPAGLFVSHNDLGVRCDRDLLDVFSLLSFQIREEQLNKTAHCTNVGGYGGLPDHGFVPCASARSYHHSKYSAVYVKHSRHLVFPIHELWLQIAKRNVTKLTCAKSPERIY
jgi:hypothetical protein